jgi:hypothetical protein
MSVAVIARVGIGIGIGIGIDNEEEHVWATHLEAVAWVPSPGVGPWSAAWRHAADTSGAAGGGLFLPDEFEQGDFP